MSIRVVHGSVSFDRRNVRLWELMKSASDQDKLTVPSVGKKCLVSPSRRRQVGKTVAKFPHRDPVLVVSVSKSFNLVESLHFVIRKLVDGDMHTALAVLNKGCLARAVLTPLAETESAMGQSARPEDICRGCAISQSYRMKIGAVCYVAHGSVAIPIMESQCTGYRPRPHIRLLHRVSPAKAKRQARFVGRDPVDHLTAIALKTPPLFFLTVDGHLGACKITVRTVRAVTRACKSTDRSVRDVLGEFNVTGRRLRGVTGQSPLFSLTGQQGRGDSPLFFLTVRQGRGPVRVTPQTVQPVMLQGQPTCRRVRVARATPPPPNA